ncbi:PspC domain-containing protein [Candidatus Daviesbacteria bacterium]|nr:PspC domain-containing protein [Candidatus Daviesbacteria bacterium]
MATTPRLYRSETNRIIAGVCGGLGEYFNIDPTIIRIIFVLMTVFGGSGILIYIILWLVTPSESSGRDLSARHIKENVKDIRQSAEKFRRLWPLILVLFGIMILFRK